MFDAMSNIISTFSHLKSTFGLLSRPNEMRDRNTKSHCTICKTSSYQVHSAWNTCNTTASHQVFLTN